MPPNETADTDETDPDAPTLDPPGTIAIIGGGLLGVEAALYGRFLGYDVTLFERSAIGSSAAGSGDAPLPLPSSRGWSPLAASALEAQYPDRFPGKGPETVAEWLDVGLIPLTETDLLRGRIRVPAEAVRIDLAEATAGEDGHDAQGVDPQPGDPGAVGDDDSSDEIPPDFRITVRGPDATTETVDFEAVILAIGPADPPAIGFATPAPYFFRVGGGARSSQPGEPGEPGDGDAELAFGRGLQEIVSAYAELAGRADLDLYRPRRT